MKINIPPVKQIGFIKGGDCAAASLEMVTGIPQRELYEKYGDRYYKSEDIAGFELRSCVKLLRKFKELKIISDIDTYVIPINHYKDDGYEFSYKTWGWVSWNNWVEWYEKLKSKIDDGWVGLVEVAFRGFAKERDFMYNHIQVINGYNEFKDSISGNLIKEIISTCSVDGELIIHPKQFLLNYGGYNTIWVKK